MTTICKFAYAVLLAVTTFGFAPNPALAQEPARGRFTLAHDVLWEAAKIPAGDYEFSYDPETVAPVLNLSKLSGARAGFILLVPATENSKPSDSSRLMLERSPEGTYVAAMQLPGSGVTLLFRAPRHPVQIAKAATTAAAAGQ